MTMAAVMDLVKAESGLDFGLMNIDVAGNFQLASSEFVGQSVAVLGMTGQGKTNTDAVIAEEALANSFPLTIIDLEGEFFSFKERYEILVAGRSPNVDIELTSLAQTRSLAELSIRRGVPVILDLSGFKTNSQDREEMFGLVETYLESLWDTAVEVRRPYLLLVEEAQEFIPQGGSSPVKELLVRIAKRGRKRGLGIVLASQRPASVDKNVLTQASMLILHKVINPNTDLKAYKDLIPLPAREVERLVGGLAVGQAVILYKNSHSVVQVRRRYTFDVGATPGFDSTQLTSKVKIDDKLIEEFSKLTAKATSSKNDGQTLSKKQAQLEGRIKELETQVLDLTNERDELQRENQRLSRLSVHLDGSTNMLFTNVPAATTVIPDPKPAPPLETLRELKIASATVQTLNVNGTLGNNDGGGGTVTNGKTAGFPVGNPAVIVGKSSSSSTLPEETSLLLNQLGLTASQQRRFDDLRQRLRRSAMLHRRMLKLLAAHESTAMTIAQMASWLKLSDTTLRNSPPTDLITMGLIGRVKTARGFKYTSRLGEYLSSHFGDGGQPDFKQMRDTLTQ